MPNFLEMMTMIWTLNLITLGVFEMAYFVQQITKTDVWSILAFLIYGCVLFMIGSP